MSLNFQQFKTHREQVIKDQGLYAGILDQNGNHLLDLPPVRNLQTRRTRLGHTEALCEIPLDIDRNGYIHEVANELISEGFSATFENGQFVANNAETRLLFIEDRSGRDVYLITIPEIGNSGANNTIDTLVIKGSSLTQYLAGFPAPSDLHSWRNAQFRTIDRDWAQEFEKPRLLAEIKMAEIADGYSEKGEADVTIAKIVRDSISAVSQAMGWEEEHMYVSSKRSGEPSPEVIIRVTDDYLWNTVADYALYAGIDIVCSLWLPGDEPVDGTTWNTPKIVIEVKQGKNPNKEDNK